MSHKTIEVAPGPAARTVTLNGKVVRVPSDWDLLPPGDAGLTRRVKAAGPTWTVKEKKGRRTFSQGVWASQKQIQEAREKLEAERSTEAYAKKQRYASERRDRKQGEYVEDFRKAILQFLDFDSAHSAMAQKLAGVVADHATPVGSGTVARTQRIPIEQRAESAVIAWMRHQTTAYDNMKIARVRGRRREVRRLLASRSRSVLDNYRTPGVRPTPNCPLRQALS